MTPEEIVAICFVSIPIILCICGLACWFVIQIKSKKFEKQYKEIFDLISENDGGSTDFCDYCNTNIWPLENQINSILSEQKYMTKEDLEESNDLLESLKQKRKEYKEVADKLNDELWGKREEIKAKILATNNKKFIKYMKGLGWLK